MLLDYSRQRAVVDLEVAELGAQVRVLQPAFINEQHEGQDDDGGKVLGMRRVAGQSRAQCDAFVLRQRFSYTRWTMVYVVSYIQI